MIIGVPREIKSDEYRVAMLPVGAELLRLAGHQLLIEASAGVGSGYEDSQYAAAGATIVPQHAEVFAKGIAHRKENGIQLPGLFGHRLDDPDFYVAYAIDEGEDEHGWWIKGEFDLESPKGAHVYRLVKSGRLRELCALQP